MEVNCEHVCSSDCRRDGCNCECPGEFHISYEPLGEYVSRKVEEQKKVYGGNMPAHNQSTLRNMLERDERENGTDYVYGVDEGEINKGNVREY